tara:strand:- start:5302 stop:6663 length:1362 start_codon:yes stop_codon:yes gene_type:complete
LSNNSNILDLEKLVSLCKRRGFIFQSSEIYGGLASTWDYGPLGVELKRNVKESWWRKFILGRDDMVGLDSSILMHPEVWKSSGHVESFSDPLVECVECHKRWREDLLQSPEGTENNCPECNGDLSAPKMFNLMFRTFMGPVADEANVVHLRPETAQGIFVNFSNVVNTTRKRPPFGIAQIGKAFRNEITTGNFIYRTREFEMMEIEFFVPSGTDDEWHQNWVTESLNWYTDLGILEANLKIREHPSKELAHYSKATSDIEYKFPWGWGEIQGTANRTNFDLLAHSDSSGQSLSYFDEESGDHKVPYVIEPSFGVDRAVMAFLTDAYQEEEAPSSSGKMEKRVFLKLHHSLAPVKVAVLPLSRNEALVPLAKEIHNKIRSSETIAGLVQYDETQSIGKRYRRQDEIGTPLCVTVDFDSIDDDEVTIRERDSMQQTRVPIYTLVEALNNLTEKTT